MVVVCFSISYDELWEVTMVCAPSTFQSVILYTMVRFHEWKSTKQLYLTVGIETKKQSISLQKNSILTGVVIAVKFLLFGYTKS